MNNLPDQAVVRIGRPVRTDREGGLRMTYPVTGLEPSELWFQVNAAGASFVDDSLDAAVATLLIPAMARSLPLRVDGPMSARLAWNLRNTVIPVVDRMLPLAQPISVHTTEIRASFPTPGKGVATGLSMGVDSLSVCMDHFLDSQVPPEERLTHLMFMHIGHHGYGSDLEARVADRWAQAQAAAREIGLPLIRVDSNAPDFYPPEHDSPFRWADTCTLRAAAGPLLLQRGLRRYLLASSFSWGFIGVRPYRYLSIADPILLPALGTETLDLAAVGTDLTRVEKTRRLAGMDLAQKFLDVCIMEGGVNCSRCEKCMRTLFTLDLLGQLQAFQGRFDLETYGRRKTVFVARLLAGRAMVLHEEIKELMDQVGYRPSVSSRLLALALRLWRLLPWGMRKRIRGRGR